MGGNLPPGTTPGDIDRAFGEPEPDPDPPEPTRPECESCGTVLPWSARWDDPPICDDCSDADSDSEADD